MAIGRLDFVMHDLDIDEIQSLDLEAIVKDKAEKAYALVQGPVIVDDVSAGLNSLNGLPGPFIKFFNEQLGSNVLHQIAKPNDRVKIDCIVAYYDGNEYILGKGTINGKIVSPRGSNGFGFDSVVVVDGHDKTMAEMPDEEKARLSHRGIAFRSLISQLEAKV